MIIKLRIYVPVGNIFFSADKMCENCLFQSTIALSEVVSHVKTIIQAD